MSNFKDDILAAAKGESILAIAVGECRGGWGDEVDHSLGNKPVSWEKAAPVLNYDYDTGYGGQDCHDIWVWTETRVLSIHEYDGATWIISVFRSPEDFSMKTQTAF